MRFMEQGTKKWLLTVLLLFSGLAALRAQGVEFSATASSTQVGTGEPFRITFSISNASHVSDFQPPAFRGLQVLSQQQSQSTSIINGKVSQSISFIYILQADNQGRFTIGGASARVDGDNLKSNPITITVEKGVASSPQSGNPNAAQPSAPNPFGFQHPEPEIQNQPGILRKGENAMAKIKKNVFIKVDVDKTNVFVGQQITATYKLYTRLTTSSQVTKVPSFTGFSTHDVKIQNPTQPTVERLNGVPFRVFTIRKTMLFPLQSGDLELDPAEIDNTVRLYQIERAGRGSSPLDNMMDDPFFKDAFGGDPFNDPFFQDAFGGASVTYHDYDYPLKSKPLTVHVKPLPETGKPENFSGAVGNFTISAKVDKNKITTDDAITLNVTVSGNGNITLINPPKVDFPTDFDSYDPKISDKVNNSNPFGGSRTFQYVLMPQTSGHFTIPPIKFAYFDPKDDKYKTLSTDAFDLEVTQGKNQKPDNANFTADNNQLQPIRTGKIAWSSAGALGFGSWWYWLLLLIPLVILIAILSLKKRNDKLQADQTLLKNKRANRVARKRLEQARQYLQQKKSKAFYGEVSDAVWGYLSDKLNIPYAELSKEKIQAALLEKQVNGNNPEKLFALLDHCEVALYAGSEGTSQMAATYQDAIDVISGLEQEFKK